jgi:hypothetical protein
MFPFGPLCNREDVFVTDASAIRRNLEICRYLIMSRSEKDVFRWTQSYGSFGMQRETMAAMAATVLLEHQHGGGDATAAGHRTNPWGPNAVPQQMHGVGMGMDKDGNSSGPMMWPAGAAEGAAGMMRPAWPVQGHGWSGGGHQQHRSSNYGHMQPDQHVGGGAGGPQKRLNRKNKKDKSGNGGGGGGHQNQGRAGAGKSKKNRSGGHGARNGSNGSGSGSGNGPSSTKSAVTNTMTAATQQQAQAIKGGAGGARNGAHLASQRAHSVSS